METLKPYLSCNAEINFSENLDNIFDNYEYIDKSIVLHQFYLKIWQYSKL